MNRNPSVIRNADRLVERHWRLFEALNIESPVKVAAELLASGRVTLRHGERAVNAALHEHLGLPVAWPVGIPRDATELYEQYGRLIAMWLLQRNKVRDDADDLLQEFWAHFMGAAVLTKFVRKLGPGSTSPEDNQRALVGYLKTVTFNLFANWCRHKNRHVIREITRPPLPDGSGWEVLLQEDDPVVEFEDRLDLARALDGILDDGEALEQTLVDISIEVARGNCTLREAALKVQAERSHLKVRQG